MNSKFCSFYFLLGVISTLAMVAVGFYFLLQESERNAITYNEADVNFDGVLDMQDAAILLTRLNKIFPQE